MEWIALASRGCRECQGLGLIHRKRTKKLCACVIRSVFWICYGYFRGDCVTEAPRTRRASNATTYTHKGEEDEEAFPDSLQANPRYQRAALPLALAYAVTARVFAKAATQTGTNAD